MRRVAIVSIFFSIIGCQGDWSEKPPVHLNPNMDQQSRFDPQEPNPFFSDGRAMRLPVPRTIAKNQLRDDPYLYTGMIGGGYAVSLPVPLTKELLNRGRDRFGIYCKVCHGGAGYGDGIVSRKGIVPPPNFHDDRLRSQPIGYFFAVISDGIRTMPPYRYQIPVEDRWAIASYVRALQLSQHAPSSHIPKDIMASKGWGKE